MHIHAHMSKDKENMINIIKQHEFIVMHRKFQPKLAAFFFLNVYKGLFKKFDHKLGDTENPNMFMKIKIIQTIFLTSVEVTWKPTIKQQTDYIIQCTITQCVIDEIKVFQNKI